MPVARIIAVPGSLPGFLLLLCLGLVSACAHRPVQDEPDPAPDPGTSAPTPQGADAEAPQAGAPAERPEISHALAELDADDFATYAAAARRLVGLGEAAIPALGRAAEADGTTEHPGVASVLRSILMGVDTGRFEQWLDAPWPIVRTVAARTAGERRLTEHAGALVRLLDDDVVSVRRAAVAALRRLSSRFFGFAPNDSSARRARAVRRWREFWDVPTPEDPRPGSAGADSGVAEAGVTGSLGPNADVGSRSRVSYHGVMDLAAPQWRLVLDRLEHGVCLLDSDGVVRWANAAMDRHFEVPGLLGRRLDEAVPALADALDWPQAAAAAIDRGRGAQLARQALPGGRHVNCSLGPTELDGVRLALLTVTDVSETVELESRLLRQARTQAIANLGDSIAHEIRNPLNSIHMNVQLLREGLKPEQLDRARLDRTAAVVLSEIKRLDRVVRDFVQFSRPPALQLEPGSVNHVLRAALDTLDAQIREKDLDLEIDLQSARPVPLDRDRLQQAFYNVLLNAVQVLPEGGQLACRSRDAERRCLIEIADDGPGLDAARCAHIFEVFYTTKAGGTGLGLPIANRIVEEHGGRMAVQSAPGRGATFAIFLPYNAAPAAARAGPTAVAPGDS